MNHKWYENAGPDNDVVLAAKVCLVRNIDRKSVV